MTRSPSLSFRDEAQRENEEWFNQAPERNDFTSAMMEKLLDQNSERVSQIDTAETTFSFGVQTCNTDLKK